MTSVISESCETLCSEEQIHQNLDSARLPRFSHVLAKKIIDIFKKPKSTNVVVVQGPHHTGTSMLTKIVLYTVSRHCNDVLYLFTECENNEDIEQRLINSIRVYSLPDARYLLVLIDNAHRCNQEALRRAISNLEMIISQQKIILILLYPAARISSGVPLGSRYVTYNLTFYPLRFVELVEALIPELRNYTRPQDVEYRYKRTTDWNELLNFTRNLYDWIVSNNLWDSIYLLFSLYLILGGTLDRTKRLSNLLINLWEECSGKINPSDLLQSLELQYGNLTRYFTDPVDEVIKDVETLKLNIHAVKGLLYLISSRSIKGALQFNEEKLNEDIQELLIQAIGTISLNKSDVRNALQVLTRSGIIFNVNNIDNKSRDNIRMRRLVFSDPRYIIGSYLLGIEDGVFNEGLNTLVEMLTNHVFNGEWNRLGHYIEAVVIANIVLHAFAIDVALDKSPSNVNPTRRVKTYIKYDREKTEIDVLVLSRPHIRECFADQTAHTWLAIQITTSEKVHVLEYKRGLELAMKEGLPIEALIIAYMPRSPRPPEYSFIEVEKGNREKIKVPVIEIAIPLLLLAF